MLDPEFVEKVTGMQKYVRFSKPPELERSQDLMY